MPKVSDNDYDNDDQYHKKHDLNVKVHSESTKGWIEEKF
jgi:hypothetical protein